MFHLTKKFRFEAAHRLAKGYTGKCSHIHGHSWNGELRMVIDKLDDFDMAIDFSVMKSMLKEIHDEFDHKLILHEGDGELIHFCNNQGYATVVMKQNPTSEALARYIFERIRVMMIEKQIKPQFIEVTIKETCTSKATYGESIHI